MSDEVEIGGTQYISSKRASKLSGYAQDYIGQLARANLITARRIGGLWYVSLDSLNAYKAKADAYKPLPPQPEQHAPELDSVISFDGKSYVSAARAAKTTGYHQDYVGQLARSGKVLSRQIGNRWYVDHEALAAHKEEKDALLGAVQAESVGISSQTDDSGSASAVEPFFTYTAETGGLLPALGRGSEADPRMAGDLDVAQYDTAVNRIPIRVFGQDAEIREKFTAKTAGYSRAMPGMTKYYGSILSVAAVIVLVAGIGFVFLQSNALYAVNNQSVAKQNAARALTASAANSARAFAEWIEGAMSPQITYTRGQ